MKIELREASKQDAALITIIMTASFNFDTATYFGEGMVDGPPDYADGYLAEKVLSNPGLITSIIIVDQEKIGLITLALEKRELAYFCLLPQSIGQGIGSQVWQLIEERYGGTGWELETPAYSSRNHFFYEKLGFVKIKEKEYPNGAVSYYYKK